MLADLENWQLVETRGGGPAGAAIGFKSALTTPEWTKLRDAHQARREPWWRFAGIPQKARVPSPRWCSIAGSESY